MVDDDAPAMVVHPPKLMRFAQSSGGGAVSSRMTSGMVEGSRQVCWPK